MYRQDNKRGDTMNMKIKTWKSLTKEERTKLIEIAAGQNWLGHKW
jgi:hypothetical protein